MLFYFLNENTNKHKHFAEELYQQHANQGIKVHKPKQLS